MTGFIIGLVLGSGAGLWGGRRAYRSALASACRMRNYWQDTATQRGVELAQADVEGNEQDAVVARLTADLLASAEEKTRLNQLLDAAGVCR